jgi:hypothetical protein
MLFGLKYVSSNKSLNAPLVCKVSSILVGHGNVAECADVQIT